MQIIVENLLLFHVRIYGKILLDTFTVIFRNIDAFLLNRKHFSANYLL